MEFRWSEDKDAALRQSRGIGFAEVVAAIAEGGLLDVLEHPNSEKFGHQKVLAVRVADYVYAVPYVEEETGDLFLKTLFPSRKLKRRYLPEADDG